MNLNENIKNYKNHKLISGPNFHCDTFLLYKLYHMTFIDVMGLNEDYRICIFMNINKIVENRGKTR